MEDSSKGDMSCTSKKCIPVILFLMGSMIISSGMAINIHAAPSSGVTGSGQVLFVCGDMTRVNEVLSFSLDVGEAHGKVKLVGSFILRDTQGGLIEGDIAGGKISKSSFLLQSNYLNHVGICTSDSIPSQGTISGTCGQTNDLVLRFENGANGRGTGIFTCSK